MTDDVEYHQSPHVFQRRSLDTVAVLAVDGDEPALLAGTGAAVWHLLLEPRSLDDLVEILTQQYAGDRGVVTADVSSLLDRLLAEHLVVRLAG
jgi:hypothetical protein